jgi:hypothetical protein
VYYILSLTTSHEACPCTGINGKPNAKEEHKSFLIVTTIWLLLMAATSKAEIRRFLMQGIFTGIAPKRIIAKKDIAA